MPSPELVAERYRRRTRAHADRVAEAVVAAFAALGPEDYVAPATAELVIARLRAAGYAAAYVDLLAATRGAVTASDTQTLIDEERLAAAARTAGAKGQGSVARLARSEPLQAGQDALSQGWRANPALDRWTRHAGGNACPVCIALTGVALPTSVPLLHPHPTCSCTQIPA